MSFLHSLFAWYSFISRTTGESRKITAVIRQMEFRPDSQQMGQYKFPVAPKSPGGHSDFAQQQISNFLGRPIPHSKLDVSSKCVLWVVRVLPDSGPHVTATCSKAASAWAGSNADDTVLVSLQHKLGIASSGVPELYSPVLGTG